jgi:hypothetical protein
MSVLPSGADIVRLYAQVRFVPFAIFCTANAILIHIPIAEVFSGSAININPEVIDHGHRPR